jgi:hypothetical protein
MTDRELLLQLLERFGLSPSTAGKWPSDATTVTLAANEGGVDGYSGFITVFHFDVDGQFHEVHIWE